MTWCPEGILEPYPSPEKKEIQDSLRIWIPRLEFRIPGIPHLCQRNLDSWFHSLVGFRVPNYPDSEIRITWGKYPSIQKNVYTYTHIHLPLGTIVSDRSSCLKFLADILRPSEWVFQNIVWRTAPELPCQDERHLGYSLSRLLPATFQLPTSESLQCVRRNLPTRGRLPRTCTISLHHSMLRCDVLGCFTSINVWISTF